MTPFHEQPLEQTYAPPSYPQPDWENGSCYVVHAYLPDGATVGYLVLSGESLVLIRTAPPATLAEVLYQSLAEDVQRFARLKTPAAEAWAALLPTFLHMGILEMPCSQVIEMVYGS